MNHDASPVNLRQVFNTSDFADSGKVHIASKSPTFDIFDIFVMKEAAQRPSTMRRSALTEADVDIDVTFLRMVPSVKNKEVEETQKQKKHRTGKRTHRKKI
eukprot:TRINITY_DN3312_c0_g2_i1.p1 TRINITY_DN3312_c0_g2~~TRINITY_DN3312_c0_g2_i1.p1  ORF type:complete len:101 (+),score=7.02 TRINITY_DN3312_c0_g2_i1:78-380(+)